MFLLVDLRAIVQLAKAGSLLQETAPTSQLGLACSLTTAMDKWNIATILTFHGNLVPHFSMELHMLCTSTFTPLARSQMAHPQVVQYILPLPLQG